MCHLDKEKRNGAGKPFLRVVAASMLLLLFATSVSRGEPLLLHGEFSIHDPSTIVKCKDEYWVFGTGRGLLSRHSKDLKTWEAGPHVFPTIPEWTTNTITKNRGVFWAPDVILHSNEYYLYYAVSSWGLKTSAIGLATTPTLDPADPRFHWTDRGVVVQTGDRQNYNAIDPAVTRDAEGKLWLVFGSYWSGIKLVQLDSATGKLASTNAPVYLLAYHGTIEAAYLCHHENYYYLFVNWDHCCAGTNSTYNIRVGRSEIITGPYLDRAGVDMLQDGGSLFLGREGRFIGPGHAGIISVGADEWFSYHFYDGEDNGKAKLGIRRLRWENDGWPRLE
ncbi:MAG TPA: arabinan endo-1,5-alpha-L-arabinosidase [Verrucomicrobiae bacterium]|nr:arabinan endo-1,5-alpha-L-arabinosidase [Verrucomicrobiae bacterium]